MRCLQTCMTHALHKMQHVLHLKRSQTLRRSSAHFRAICFFFAKRNPTCMQPHTQTRHTKTHTYIQNTCIYTHTTDATAQMPHIYTYVCCHTVLHIPVVRGRLHICQVGLSSCCFSAMVRHLCWQYHWSPSCHSPVCSMCVYVCVFV